MAEQFIKEENKISEETESSPSGKYKLVISKYKTRQNCWSYACGTLFRISDNQLIATINRNYDILYHSWFTKNNQEWFQSGSTYMSQTFINLETGKVYDNTDQLKQTERYQQGMEFCWAKSMIRQDGNTLAVLGCFWGGSYDYKFFDFTNPENGWKELENKDDCGQYPEGYALWNTDGTFTISNSREFIKKDGKILNSDFEEEEYIGTPEEIRHSEDDENILYIEEQLRVLKREGHKMVTVSLWQSGDRKEREKRWKDYMPQLENKKENVSIITTS